ncbi:ABC transporter ATP-binding protein [Subsaximicrobium wynnwilliamsii]|uniref:ABC transporter ATP-binding protein n=1 Tax=Subsaximicrobium wynnwilliamsii TaxID=291179 RepID=A0A5C6ZLX0_9FLAO|nr:ATP-binding cassette domain-containing protein [Subsaximicrobium wynnwilliamsii]TXD84717.1 ABC transporter ATP-binding protein [Subsaximicrobium wynnwilliamsii]TXD90387.1 ABC transporter ATP-binding protein [Subsaximicrobium wynnwilliamsii]TXE04863.1 ABC transporter ATP-binding protein [Subsaximicrobium wynnwilliamsii]
MTQAKLRIQEVNSFFKNKDTVLGYRKLMDCAIDTQDLAIYKKVIALTDWKSQHPEQEVAFIEKALSLLNEISKIPITEYQREKPVVVGENLIKSYGINRFELGPISTTIHKGEVYGLVGENGNGKTTLLRILAKEIGYDKGQLHYNFDSIYKSDYELRTNLVYIPQRTQKWYGSLKDNLKFVLSSYGIPPEENETRVLMMIARFGLWPYKHLKWNELSSGYKMRFELARTLLRQPELLLLDEPLANLDVLAQQVILEDLKSMCNSINKPIALILSSQQLYEVEKISDKVIYLRDGKYTDNNAMPSTDHKSQLIIEIDSELERDALTSVFVELQLEKLNYNGGIYVAYFNESTSFPSVLTALGTHKVNATYIRNITKSTRRFFVS